MAKQYESGSLDFDPAAYAEELRKNRIVKENDNLIELNKLKEELNIFQMQQTIKDLQKKIDAHSKRIKQLDLKLM